jgi:glycosyltransferase involved in cell wall biosynthesis
MKINLIGQRNSSGIGNHFASFADAMTDLDGIGSHVQELNFQDPDAVVDAARASTDQDVTVSFVGMNIHDLFRGLRIQWIVFESTRIPVDVLRSAEMADVVWVPTSWGRDVLIANGIAQHKIDVVPEGVNHNLFHPHGRQAESRPFRFLVVGKYEIRKSYPEIFRAFAEEFGNDPAVELVMKSDYFRDGDAKAQQMIADLRSHGFENWRLNWGYADIKTIADMYRTSNVFLSAPRGEAWGLPIIEAAASGLPVISTLYSGHGEFLQTISNSVIPVDYDLGAVDCDEYKGYYPFPDGDWGEWALPRVDSIRSAMRTAYLNHGDLAKLARKNSQKIRTEFSWTASADRAVQAMESRGIGFA